MPAPRISDLPLTDEERSPSFALRSTVGCAKTQPPIYPERWQSGRMRVIGNHVLSQGNRGFESPPLRQFSLGQKIGSPEGVCWVGIGSNGVEQDQVAVTRTDIPHITPFKQNGEVIGWVTALGRAGDGKLRRKFFSEKSDAERFFDDHVRLSVDPLHGRRHEVLFCLEQIDRIGVTLHEVVEFYVRHGSKRTNPLLTDSIKTFFDHKRMIGRGHHYVGRMTVVLRQVCVGLKT